MPLPPEILRARLRNEIQACHRQLKHHVQVSDAELSRFPVIINVALLRTPGPVWADDRIATRYVHNLRIIITEDYPYEKPIVKWQTPIFHPNIMEPKDGGYVCTKLLEKWDFRSTLATFIVGLEVMLANPNPDSPFGSDSCTRAAEYFRTNHYRPPIISGNKIPPKIVGDVNDRS